MSWAAFLLAAVKSLPAVIALIAQFKTAADAKANRGLGYDAAVANALREASEKIATAHAVEADSEKAHSANPKDDGAFDQEFKRVD